MVKNHEPLRERLAAKNYTFSSETDAETLVNLIECVTLAAVRTDSASFTKDLTTGIRWTLSHAKGEYAFALMSRHTPDRLFAACVHSPLFVVEALDGALVFSDLAAIPDSVRDVRPLVAGEIAILHQSGKIEILQA
jgi:glucosamine--fructose-6-phosphate aminotransferase (isomerizing)